MEHNGAIVPNWCFVVTFEVRRNGHGITKRIGWHTFRHSYGTLLKGNGEDVKVVRESLRHANSRITLDTYVQAMTPAKRQAQGKVVGMILPKGITSEAEMEA